MKYLKAGSTVLLRNGEEKFVSAVEPISPPAGRYSYNIRLDDVWYSYTDGGFLNLKGYSPRDIVSIC